MSPSTIESGIKNQNEILTILGKVITREESLIATGENPPIENFGLLKKHVEEQLLATLALNELLARQLPRLKEEAAAEAAQKKQKQPNKGEKKKKPIATSYEIEMLENINLFQ